MKRRQWDANAKARIVLEGPQGKPVAELCTEHQINQSPYDQWRDPCLANASQAFEAPQDVGKTRAWRGRMPGERPSSAS